MNMMNSPVVSRRGPSLALMAVRLALACCVI
uniref:Uncharacterized protein n=1 Tax=Anguilla anguilla TaxID=7936 RepID=A0A0E9RRZ5_ANGAN